MVYLGLVMIGGASGAAARYGVGRLLPAVQAGTWPWPTFSVNLIGGLLMGLLAGWLLRTGANDGWRLLLGVGFLGGFTTFSAFGLEMLQLLMSGRILTALTYALISVAGAVTATWIGLILTRGAAL